MKLSEIVIPPSNFLIYGAPGCGKTAFVCTLGKYAEVYDFDRGLETCLHLNDKYKSIRAEIDVANVYYDLDLSNPRQWVKFKNDIYTKTLPGIKNGKYKNKFIIIDSLTRMFDHALFFVMKASGKVLTGEQLPKVELQHWLLAFNEIKAVVGALCAADTSIVLTAHRNKVFEGEGNAARRYIELGVSGRNMQDWMAAQFSEFWHMYVSEVGQGKLAYKLQTKQSPTAEARSRLGVEDRVDVSQVGFLELISRYGVYTDLAKEQARQLAS